MNPIETALKKLENSQALNSMGEPIGLVDIDIVRPIIEELEVDLLAEFEAKQTKNEKENY